MPDLPKLYIDSCVFIDMAKHHAKHHPKNTPECDIWFTKQLLQASRDKKIKIFASIITIAECTHISQQNAPKPSENIKRFYNGLLASGTSGITLVQPTLTIMERARNLRWIDGIYLSGAADSIHIATALVMQCREFLTTDNKIIKNQPKLQELNLKVCKPQKTNHLPEPYKHPPPETPPLPLPTSPPPNKKPKK